ncbi:MAG: hypothetical protein U1F65_05740 [Verrucomicrobiota bacterium]
MANSVSVNTPASATDAAKNLSGAFSSYAEAGSLLVGANTKFTASGANSGTMKTNTVDLKGGKVGGKNNTVTYNVESSDPATAQLAIASNSGLVDKFTTAFASLVDKTTKASADTQAQTLDAISSLADKASTQSFQAATQSAASTATGGLSYFQKTIMVIGVGLLVVVGIALFRRNK